jgi:hypothetical protein
MYFERLSIAKVSLEEFCSCIERAKENELLWGYIIISIHNSLQNYIVAGLRNDNVLDTWKANQAKKWQKKFNLAYQGINDPEIPQLDYFLELYDKAFADETSINRDLIENLNSLRNEFIHFNTDHFDLEKEYAISICKEAIKTLKAIPKQFNKLFQNRQQKSDFTALCLKAEQLINDLQ